MNTRDTLLAAARILQSSDARFDFAFPRSRTPAIMVHGAIAAQVNASGAIVVWGVVDNSGTVILRAHPCKAETAEEIARLVTVRQLLVDAVSLCAAA